MFNSVYEVLSVTVALQALVMVVAMVAKTVTGKLIKRSMMVVTLMAAFICAILWVVYLCQKLFLGTAGSIREAEVFLSFIAVITITVKYWLIRIKAIKVESANIELLEASVVAEDSNRELLEIMEDPRQRLGRSGGILNSIDCSMPYKPISARHRLAQLKKFSGFKQSFNLPTILGGGFKKYLVFFVAPFIAILNYVYVITL